MGWTRNNITVGAVAAVAVTIGLAAPAQADTNEDRQFLAALRSAGWTIDSASVLTGRAHMVCNEGLAHGVSVQEMHTTLVGYGYSSLDASTLISKAVQVYCPEHSDALEGIDTGSNGGGSTSVGDLFVQDLRRINISIDADTAMEMARTGCNSPLAGPGYSNMLLVLHQRYPAYDTNTVALVVAHGVRAFCPERMP